MEVFRLQNVYADLSSVCIVLTQEYETFWGRRISTGCPQPKPKSILKTCFSVTEPISIPFTIPVMLQTFAHIPHSHQMH